MTFHYAYGLLSCTRGGYHVLGTTPIPVLHDLPFHKAGWLAILPVPVGNLNITQYRNLLAFGPRPFWNASIQGDGIIVGVTDTGLDMSQCYFIDDAYRPGSLRTLFMGNPPRLSLPSHRKVVQYMLAEAQGERLWGGAKVTLRGCGYFSRLLHATLSRTRATSSSIEHTQFGR